MKKNLAEVEVNAEASAEAGLDQDNEPQSPLYRWVMWQADAAM